MKRHFDCNKIWELFSSLLDGDCGDEVEQQMNVHIERCPICGCHFRTFEKTVYLCRSIREYEYFEVPEDIHQDFWQFIKDEIFSSKTVGALLRGDRRRRKSNVLRKGK
ncbi:MAG: zf-HC2 domain-containing protein [Elusimicrobiota bacterium]